MVGTCKCRISTSDRCRRTEGNKDNCWLSSRKERESENILLFLEGVYTNNLCVLWKLLIRLLLISSHSVSSRMFDMSWYDIVSSFSSVCLSTDLGEREQTSFLPYQISWTWENSGKLIWSYCPPQDWWLVSISGYIWMGLSPIHFIHSISCLIYPPDRYVDIM